LEERRWVKVGQRRERDRTRFGTVELIVRDMQGDAITQIGVELDPAPEHPWRSWLPPFHWWRR
jgi:hypothetical protein